MQALDRTGRMATGDAQGSRVEVIVTTVDAYVRGHIRVAPGQRVYDILNSSAEEFLALSEVSLTDYSDGQRQDLPVVTLNKRHIVRVIPVDEDGPPWLD